MSVLAPTLPITRAPVMDPQARYGFGHVEGLPVSQTQFKKHKNLPRPLSERSPGKTLPRVRTQDLHIDTQRPGSSGSLPASPRALKHMTKRIGSGPDLPPTPPIHSRTPSGPKPVLPPSPTVPEEQEVSTPTIAVQKAPSTPPDQRSPPTPEVTPPQPRTRPRALRPSLVDRGASRSTTADSRTESFKTAREEPFSSGEDEDGRSTVRGAAASGRTSRATFRRISDDARSSRTPQPLALSTALAGLNEANDDVYTPRAMGDFGHFDGGWNSKEELQRADGDKQWQNVVVTRKGKKTKKAPVALKKEPVLDDVVATKTEATRAVRKMPLRPTVSTSSPPRKSSDRVTVSTGPSRSATSISHDARNTSTRSSQSTRSTIVEAVLIEAPPQRQRTLRHVRKQNTLREPLRVTSSPTPPAQSAALKKLLQDHELARPDRSRHESYASTSTAASAGSSRARREVWKSGGIPVVVVPDRASSRKLNSTQTPSLRSTSSRRSKRTQSLDSAPVIEPAERRSGPIFDRPARRSRPQSLSEGSERTMDYPPIVPKRSSSLSAPTSRNASRSNSLTAESLRAHNEAINAQKPVKQEAVAVPKTQPPVEDVAQVPHLTVESPATESNVHSSMPTEVEKVNTRDTLDTAHSDDGRSGRRTHPRNTPFSVASFATTGTAPEIAEATAVQMYPHQKSSILFVENSGRSSNESKETRRASMPPLPSSQDVPTIQAPSTPPQPIFSLEDVDSPLRNPRAPPEPPSHPPTFNFIPATPSGNTPATDKAVQMGNYFEIAGGKPSRRPSLVRRALSKRRHSISYPPSAARPEIKPGGLLHRALSLSRHPKNLPKTSAPDLENHSKYPQEDEEPAEGNKLHPFWRPSWLPDDDDECGEDCDCRREEHSGEDEYYRYPPVDNRPPRRRRTFSEKMKRTFAIMPLENDLYYEEPTTDRRTIKRTPSGNLRVVRQRASSESLKQRQAVESGPSTESEELQARRSFWRGHTVRRRASKEQLRRRSSLGSRLEELQNLPRRMSEKRRERRTQELRRQISGPTGVRDGVDEMVRPANNRVQRQGA